MGEKSAGEQSQITVRQHKGRSGKSVYEWRVYREGLFNGVKPYRFQLGKFRSEARANASAAHYRTRDAIALAERGA